MNSTYNPGRVAGLWYLLLIAIGPFFLIYIPGKLYVKGNAAATINNIAAHELLFRFGILAELIGGVILVFLVLAFYRLFKGVDQYLAVLVVILGGVMPAVIYFVNVVNDLGAHDRARRRFLVRIRQTSAGRGGNGVPASAQFSNQCFARPCGCVAASVGGASVPVTFSAALPRCLARFRRLCLVDFELCGNTRAGISRQAFCHLPTRLLRGNSAHVVAHRQGREAASVGRRSPIVGG